MADMQEYFPYLYLLIKILKGYSHIYPKPQLAYTGTIIVIKCRSSTPSIWLLNGELLHIRVSKLILEQVDEKHSGVYTCKGTHAGEIFADSSHLFVG